MWIKKFLRYKEYLNESLSIWYDSLLFSIKAQEIRLEETLHLKTTNTDLKILDGFEGVQIIILGEKLKF